MHSKDRFVVVVGVCVMGQSKGLGIILHIYTLNVDHEWKQQLGVDSVRGHIESRNNGIILRMLCVCACVFATTVHSLRSLVFAYTCDRLCRIDSYV